MKWVVSFSILRPFGPFPVNTMLRAGLECCGDDEALQDVKAYCQYRLGDLEGALTASVDNEAVAHVRAQTLYKQGKYAEAADIYASLLFDEREDRPKRSAADRRELEANYYAACALAGKGREAISRLKPPDDPEQHHELAYNRGCCEAQCGSIEATKTLEKALSGAERAVEEDGASIQEKTDETAQYAAQLAYALERSGDSGQAVERAKTLLKQKPSDSAVRFAATCTLVAARRDETDLFDSHKRLKPYAANGFADLSEKHAALGRLLWARTLFAMGKTQDALSALETPFTSPEDQCDAELLIAVHSQPEKQKKKVRRRRPLSSFGAASPARRAPLSFNAGQGQGRRRHFSGGPREEAHCGRRGAHPGHRASFRFCEEEEC